MLQKAVLGVLCMTMTTACFWCCGIDARFLEICEKYLVLFRHSATCFWKISIVQRLALYFFERFLV